MGLVGKSEVGTQGVLRCQPPPFDVLSALRLRKVLALESKVPRMVCWMGSCEDPFKDRLLRML